jgi:hypothetical protein
VQYPYGVSIFEQRPPQGGTVASFCSIRCIGRGGSTPVDGAIRTLTVAGLPATQVEVWRQPPLDGSGETTPYVEIWTGIVMPERVLILVAFFREGDTVAEAYVRDAYAAILDSLVITPRT